MMMCAATASPAAASSGPGGDGFFPAATISSSPAPGALFMSVPEGSVAAAGLGLGLPTLDSRGHYQLLLSGRALADRYRRIYTAALSDRDLGGTSAGHPASRNKKILNKKKLKRKQKSKSKVKTRSKSENLENTVIIPDIKLHSNPSAFNIYCNVRHCVLEWQKKETSLAAASKNSVQSGESDSDEEEESKEPPIKLPKIIEVGLCEVFELIKETRFSHPSLCLRSLQALLNVLQGQQPEGLQSEPPEVLESLFQLLLEITVRSTGMNDSTGQSLTALSCACLFSLVASWGETGRTLQAISAILTNNGSHACQTIQVPTILNSLQRSVQAVLVGKIQIQDWFSNGIKKAALMHKWPLKEISVDEDDQCLLQNDGFFLYLLCKDGLYKIGSGYSGTVRGHIYNSTSRIRNRREKKSWLGYAQGYLLYRDVNNHSMTAIRISPETLEQDGTVMLPDCHTEGQNILFTDGEYINQIAASRDDGFVVRIFATSTEPVLQQELQLKLARKCLHACGISLFDLEKDLHIISTGFDEESAVLGAGREFALMKTANGKIYYTGKYQSLGIKQGGPSAGKWVELPITKSPKIVHFSVGHDGSHALLVAEDGSIFFTGSASKGEDGESTKSRRQSKPYKPKKIIKMEGKIVVYTACNNGSSSVISKDGELYMFGKDAIYSDSSSLVTDLKGHFVVQVAMGKAHTCVLMKNGEVWTFGVNNKGQCGRDTGAMSQGGKGFGVENMATAMDEDLEEELDEKDEKSMMCPPGMHKWKLEQCMVCTVCGDCTGYGASCVSSGRPDRVPGGICGCGSGESGCAVCGCCKACARELDGQEARQRGILDAVKEMIPLDLLLAVPVPGVNIEEHLQLRQEEKRQRVIRRHRLEEGRDGSGERGEKDASKITTYPPGSVRFDCELRAVQVSCGFHHSVVLMENGDVYTFGYGQHGQLGHGDVNSRGCPTLVQALPGPSTQVTAGSNHTAVLLMDGQVFTFGSFSKGQLGRPILDVPYWNAKPAPMPNIGSKYGRKATWIGASGDQTFLRIDEALINSHVLATSEIFASKHIIGLVPASISEPPPFKCLLINKIDGSCKTFNDSEQEDLQGFGVCLDPVYDVIWRFRPNTRELWCYNAVVADARLPSGTDMQSRCSILSPELALPTGSRALTTRSHAALHILGCLDTLATMQDLKMGIANTEEETQAVMKVYSKEDYSVVNRFESHGGGWGYSAHSVEAIRFSADTDILLGGLGLFGGRGEYTAKIKLFELGPDGGDHETDGDLLAETDVLAYDCAAREKYAMMFDEPVLLQAGWWYVAWARVSGPSSDCGSHGQASITTDDGVVFQFKSSKKSNNGTDVNAGQIPQLLYRLPTSDGSASKGKQQTSEPVHILKRSFARTVSVECFESLLSILHWSWTTLVLGVEELRGLKGFQFTATLLDLERLRFVGTCCLRLLRVYTCEIYPVSATGKAVVEETSKLAECIGKTRTLLRKILSEGVDHCMVKLDNDPQGYLSQPLSLLEAVLQECHNTFTACFHSFYPTPALQWACLCDLLNCLDQDIQEANFKTSSSRLLAAVMSALCHTSVKLTSIFPIAYDGEVLLRSIVKQVSTENDSTLVHRFPLLVAQMEKLSQSEENISGMTSFREVLEKMLVIVVLPVRNSLRRQNELFSSHLVSNTCGLLASIVSELTASALGSEVDGLNSLHSVKASANRFTKTSQGRSWNTGNGSPDAICFSVDKPGVVVVGFSVYGGGGIHEYELEVLVDDSEHAGDSTHSHRWTSLELVKGTYTTDDSPSDIAEIRLDKVVPLKENVKYAVRLRNYGSRTANGDGGMTTVQCPDGVTFTFSTCSLSSNGTNQTRGQIPQILYYRSEFDGDLQSQLLSKANEEDKNCSRALSVVSTVVRAAKDLLHRALAVDADDIPELLSSSSLFSMLLPLIIAYIGPVAAAIPKVAVEVFGLVQQLLPSVAILNQKYAPPAFNPNQSTDSTTGNQPEQGLSACTTSNHYAVIESEHPYKPASVMHYKVAFPECVRWMTIEFDPQCGTAQSEDVLRLLIPVRTIQNSGYGPKLTSVHENLNSWIELKKFSGSSGWPTMVLVLPGNEALFSLETASDYVKDDKASFYGFKCFAIGYEFSPGPDEGVIQLEKELANLGGVCAAALMKKDLALPIGNELEEDLEILEEAALQVCKTHSGILGKGLALSHSPTILEALEGNLPLQIQSNEQSFLDDFIACVPGSSGGRLARWLQPDSYADPQKTSLILNKDDIRCGWPTTITVQTKDQYGDVVHVPNMKVEVKAVPVSQKKASLQQEQVKKSQRIPGSPAVTAASANADMTFGGLASPKLDVSYEPMIVKEARYIAITMMKVYENYSFEELRFASPTPKRPSENMLIRVNNDGTYCANWTPGAIGLYTIHVTIDGIEIDAGLEVKVKDPPKGMIPPGTQLVKPKAEPQPNKVRKFVAKDSAGLRIRSHPSLQSEQIGIVKVNGTITFIDEIHNDDGVWLRLNDETIKKYVPNINGYTEAWCLSFNQHLGKSLLVPVDNIFNASQGVRDLDVFSWTSKPFFPQEPKTNTDDFFKDMNTCCPQEATMQEQDMPFLRGGPGMYKVVKTGPSGHNIRSCPNLRGIPIGMLVLGNKVKAVGEVTNSEGTWVQLDKNSMVEFCESDEGEAWSLARDRGGNQYLRHEDEQVLLDQNSQTPPPSPFSMQGFNKGASCSAQGFDYGLGNNKGDQLSAILNSIQSRPNLPAPSIFDQAAKPPSSLVHSPFVFGQPLSFQQPQLQSDRGNMSTSSRPVLTSGKSELSSKHSRSLKPDGRMSRTTTDQKKPRGCGRYAGGQGYNSIGHFCGGWAGNCGDGGIGGSTWYLVCDRCREKYLREKQAAAREKVKQSRRKPMQVKTPRALPTMEAHQVIKANALFLLSLSSAAEPSILCYHPAKPFQSQLPSVKEGISEDLPVKMPCLYLQTLARHHHENFVGYQDDNLFQDEMRYLRSTSVPAPYISVTPDAIPNVFEEPESNMKSMPPSLETSPITDTDLAKRTVFQRSYSVVASEYDKQHSILPARVKAIPRRRVNSGDTEVGSSLLRHPSPELSRLISAHSSLSKGERNFQWPVLAFVIQHHDLEGLEIAMKQALRKSACRVFAMEAFNWLLCNVIQTTSLHDILWHFVASLTPAPIEPEEEEDEENKTNKENAEQEKDTRVCEHPLSDIVIAGEAAHPLPHTFHRLLQTISDLMMSLPSGSSLQQMALRCWSLKFKQSDHQFLHQSNVFHHINNILSKSDDGDSEESFSISIQSGFEAMSQELCIVMCLKDLTSIVDIKTSSRPAMIGSLTDGSTETFWESGDEDKNKTKNITINCVKGINARYVSVHVDNSRDLGNKVTSMTFLTGKAVEDLCRIKQVDLDSRHIGWVTSELPGGDNHIIKIELKGPENTLRVRQVKVLGWKDGESTKIAGQISASVAQQRNCEAETLRVFRLITSQVFGKLISGDAEPTPEQEEKALLSSPEGEEKVYNATSDADLKEHMVGIIFSRSKLTNLQKQVCAHIVQAIRMEATRVREEWEHAISSKENANSQPNDEDASSDAYCFELLSMVLALSGSNVGRQYLAQQLTLLQDLFSLLHTASPRVQRQVTSLLRRVLPEVTPSRLASIIGVKSLPPADISDIIHSTEKGDWNKLGILDMFLGCIAKALTVQLKAKGTTITGTAGTTVGKGVTTVTLPMIFNSSYLRRGESHWWMKGSTPTQISEIIIKLIKDMAAGHLSEAWSRVTKNAIAETIIALTKMEEEFRSPVRCIATTRLWLALASLCVLDQDHVDRLSSGRWMGKDGQQKQMPMCDNHDDGETAAIILCNVCGNLCTDCDRFLHLHRRTKTHQRQVFKEEEEAIKVDLHEGCGRTKLFWLMALADSKTMKAMVEFREHTGKPTTSSSEACRFCGSRSGTELSAVGSVCSDADCQEYAKIACSKTHPCGHPCGGVKNEEHCLPCLHGCDKNATTLKQDADDMCMICFTEALSAAPAIQLDCSHVFHLQCCRQVLENRWLGPRITFGFISCPICKNKINHIVLKDLLDPIKELYEDVRRKALMRLEYEGLHKSEAITTPGVRFYNDPAGYAMNRYAYYVCYKCRKAYFGGEARCDAEAGQGDDYDPRELICGACSDVSRAQMCPKHGTDFLEYKCRYCCSVAVFFCFGTTHFCNACHDDFQRMTSIPKEELPHCPAGPKGKQLEGTECPLHVVHPPTGEEFALGCGVCRNAHTF
ncbi:E3 ubiquitin-protein ligase MYCBP2 isoform X5 [Callospermophilus lateralis]|uniref:E3 ubiquitin-protein ligase MYCBP2 isoform X5 n=1 Tax=Callospermophilus lateralis TaxID=76772 RepID=UPI004053AD20